jgi:hypothetical protein
MLVGRCGESGVVEAEEEVGSIAACDLDQVVDEGGGPGAQPQARRLARKLAEEVPELGLRLRRIPGTVDTLGVRAELMS